MTVENETKKNRRTLSESELYQDELYGPNSQKRSHSLPHRYKIPRNNFPNFSAQSSPNIRRVCYSPDEFKRGIQAMQTWFRNLDDNQRSLALQSITVSERILFFSRIFFSRMGK